MSAEILAPMPGLIIEICVGVGDEVTEFQTVAVLEAMKMENQIASTADGKVAEIKIKVGDAVKADQVLVVIE
jgi:biotin carboxyl carrier protein